MNKEIIMKMKLKWKWKIMKWIKINEKYKNESNNNEINNE